MTPGDLWIPHLWRSLKSDFAQPVDPNTQPQLLEKMRQSVQEMHKAKPCQQSQILCSLPASLQISSFRSSLYHVYPEEEAPGGLVFLEILVVGMGLDCFYWVIENRRTPVGLARSLGSKKP